MVLFEKSFAMLWLMLSDSFFLLKNSARYFFNQKHMLDIFWGICTTPIKNQMVHPLIISEDYTAGSAHA